jgi:hypothetical protein
MYIYDRELSALRPRRNKQPVILRPSQRYEYPTWDPAALEQHALGQGVPSPASYNTPGVTFDPRSDYILAPEVMDAVDKLLSRKVPKAHLMDLGSNVDPLMVERALVIFRYDDGLLRIDAVYFGTAPRKAKTTGSILGGGATIYSAKPVLDPIPRTDAAGRVLSQAAPPWLLIHTHPNVNKIPEVPSGIRKENSLLSGDLYTLRREPNRQFGIMTIGVNECIEDFRTARQAIPFTLALRDPIKGPTDYGPTPVLQTHKAAATALRLMFRSPTVSGYYTGDLRTGRATPYLSARQQRKIAARAGA